VDVHDERHDDVTITQPLVVVRWEDLVDRRPHGVVLRGEDLVVVRLGDRHSVLTGRCLHRGARLADGAVAGDDLVCSLHGWDYRIDTGISSYDSNQCLHRFASAVVDGDVVIDAEELHRHQRRRPETVQGRSAASDQLVDGELDEYHWHDGNPHNDTPEEPYVSEIHRLARHGLERVGTHGPIAAMGVPREQLPSWDSLQFVTAQLARLPLLDHVAVDATTTIGPGAARPLVLERPVFVSDMSFGALSQEAKVALARGAELAGTAICSGEGGMLDEEQRACSRYLYELGSGRFGWDESLLGRVQALHLKLGQGAKTGTGGHLPGSKVVGRIAEVRGLPEGTAAVSPPRFPGWDSLDDHRRFLDRVRELSGGIPMGVKMSAQHIEADLDAALEIGVDYVILDGRGGGTGAAPLLFRDNISVPTIPALARARRHLDHRGATEVTLVITGGIRTPADMAKALALGADAVAVSNSALQAIGCVGMRACHTDRCPVGIATQDPRLRARLPVDEAAERLDRFLRAATDLMGVLARACGHDRLAAFGLDDLSTFDREMHHLSGVAYAGVSA
jgi:glutamate synthase domain-containing protein 2/nitrite reductase/ring-hydroxylating ferredoxin subunit